MKKITLIIVFIFLATVVSSVIGQTKISSPAATVIPTVKPEDVEIKNLKDKIATKVAQLRKRNQDIVTGYIAKLSDSGFRMRLDDEREFDVKIDPVLTKIFQIAGNVTKEVAQKDLKKDSYVIINGPQIDKTITANDIYVDEQFFVGVGKVTEVNKDDLSIKVTTADKEIYTLDIEVGTKQMILNIKTHEIEKTGFSKFKEGDTTHFVFKKSATDEAAIRFSATRTLIIPQEYFIK